MLKTLKIPQPTGVGLLVNDATSPQRRSVAYATVRHGFHHRCPNFKNKLKMYLARRIHATIRRKHDGSSMYLSVNVAE